LNELRRRLIQKSVLSKFFAASDPGTHRLASFFKQCQADLLGKHHFPGH
jgi:hypothetical protein